MSFDKDTRNALSKMVATCRRLLTEDVTDQLRGRFGMHPDGTILSIDRLDLAEDEKASAESLRELHDHFVTGEAGRAEERKRGAYDRLVLEISFTALNRLAALRLCEERGLVVECVRKGTASDGFRLFERVSGGALGARHKTYRLFLGCLFDELALDLGVLFDRSTPQSAVFPGERCLTDVLAELNKPELAYLWTADETIGWIYQYFNPKEERKAMREASQAPRNSRELAVRNQFFTPRYVVEFLTDNTLGRIWYEMRQGDTSLKEECRYLVRRSNEVFLAPGETAPPSEEKDADLSQDELLKRPVYIEYRPKKDPRDLRVLDPACGSGHFLLYAFDLLERIYEEAWGDPDAPKSGVTGRRLREEYKTLDDLRRAAPKLIVEHNIHGIDIDPRAVQIAALALWLRAQKTWKGLGLKPTERPRIERSNIVTAEPMPGEEDMRREFTASLKPRVLGQLVDLVFEKMKLAGEAGSVLKIEEEIKDVVAKAKRQWLEGPKPEQTVLFPELVKPEPRQQMLFDVEDITDDQFWEQAEDLIVAALRRYAEQAENGRAVRRRLFAEDAARGFAFIDLCRKRYDVVLMNPPFGTLPHNRKLDTCLPAASAGNLYGAFFIRMAERLCDGGCVGCITDRTFLLLPTYQQYRDALRRIGLRALADLGWEVLDGAQVATAAYVVHSHSIPDIWFVDCRNHSDKEAVVYKACTTGDGAAVIQNDVFEAIPRHPIPHWAPPLLRNAFKHHRCFEPEFGIVRKGLSPGDSDRFVNVWWEIPQNEYGIDSRWAPYANGGPFSPFYRACKEVVEWRSNGKVIRAYTFPDGRPRYVIRSAHLYGTAGLTFGKRGEVLNVQVLPGGQVLSNEGYIILPLGTQREVWIFLAFFNSVIARYLVNMVCGLHKEVGAIKVTPVVTKLVSVAGTALVTHSKLIYEACRELGNEETNPEFITVQLGKYSNLKSLLMDHSNRLRELESRIAANEELINKEISSRFGVDKSEFGKIRFAQTALTKSVELNSLSEVVDPTSSIVSLLIGILFGRWDIRIAMDPSLAPKLPDPFDPLPVCPPGMLVGPDGLPAEPDRIVSEQWLGARPDANTLPPKGSVKKPTIPDSEYPLRISWHGILVDDPGFNGGQPHRDDIVRRVREVLGLLWKDKAHAIEREACEILGVKELRDYFRRPAGFFQDHLKRYSKSRRKAPIYWPLSTASGSYTFWIYYHRLTDQMLYAAVNKYVEPKIAEVERATSRIEKELESASGRDATQLRDRLNQGRALAGELRDLRQELLRIAALPYKPNLNDGVIINAAPLHKLFRLRSWAKNTGKVWKKLEKGDYDWAHLAYTLWPDRVREVCRTDRSSAIAHGLEDLCEVAPPQPRASRKARVRRSKS